MTPPSRRPGPVIVTGGGTAGHVLPALAIADGLVDAGLEQTDVHYVGTTRGIERSLVPPTGYAATYLDVVGLQRSLSRRNLAVAPKLIGSLRQARQLLRRLRPAAVVNVGGYGSFPASFAARMARVPLIVVSYDHRPGLVSKLMARRAALVAVAFPGSLLPKARLTGAPVRPALIALGAPGELARQRDAARAARGIPLDRFVVAVACGSLGSKAVNSAVAGLVEHWSDRADVAVYHVIGDRFLGEASPARDGSDGIMYRVVGFETDIAGLYAAADVMITRAGAGTLAELTTVGAAAIVVPWPDAAENHQVDNAKQLGDVGAAVVVDEATMSVARLADEIERLRTNPQALAELRNAAHAAGAEHRSGKLIAAIREVAGR